MLAAARRLLVCLRWGIGDVVMQTPAVEALRAAVPEAEITAVGAHPATQLLAVDDRVDRVLAYQDFGFRHWGASGRGGRRRGVARWLRRSAFDAVLDAHVAPPGFAAPVWRRGGRLLSADPGAESAMVGAGGDAVDALKEGVRAGWGIAVPSQRRPSLRPGAAARAFARSWLAPLESRGAPLAVAPFAGSPLKRWPAEGFAAAVRPLVGETGAPVLLLAAPADDAAARVGARLVSDVPLLVFPPSHLLRTAAVLERCRLLLSNDTGVMHVARAVGTPIVGVFGPSAPGVYFTGGREDHAVGGGFPCPHRNTTSLDPPPCCRLGECRIGLRSCIDRVAVREVVEALRVVDAATGGLEGARSARGPGGGPGARRLRSGGARARAGAPGARPRPDPCGPAPAPRTSP